MKRIEHFHEYEEVEKNLKKNNKICWSYVIELYELQFL